MTVNAEGTHEASSFTVNVATGIFAAGITVSRVNEARSTDAEGDPA